MIKIEITDQENEQVGAFSDLHEKRNFTSSPMKTGNEEKFDEKKLQDSNERSTIMRDKVQGFNSNPSLPNETEKGQSFHVSSKSANSSNFSSQGQE